MISAAVGWWTSSPGGLPSIAGEEQMMRWTNRWSLVSSANVEAENDDLEEKPVRLPGEEEWEYAASGVKGLQYGWGREFDKGLGNTGETGLERTSTVGLFSAGQAVGPAPESKKFGLYDMSGNVWEWMATRGVMISARKIYL